MLRKNIPTIVIMLTVGIALFSLSTALAVNGPAATKVNTDKTSAHLAMLKERLRLTDAQTEKIKVIMEDSRKEAMSQREKFKGNPEAAAKFREEHRKVTDEKIKAVLNDEQKKEYDKIKNDNRKNMQERRQKRDTDKMGPGPGGERRGPGEGFRGGK